MVVVLKESGRGDYMGWIHVAAFELAERRRGVLERIKGALFSFPFLIV